MAPNRSESHLARQGAARKTTCYWHAEDRKKRTRDIVEAAKQRQGDKPTAPFDDFAKLHRQLLAICNKPPAANARRLSFR